ncbi:YetF domain-containing protein [Caldisalinibacter kiritimatiensis]|uniref:YetF C-terminal domain-containing protein n=1 Tax=Caldisalinibacter kiritimatiensis TaxID=1304284 RepID=R1CW57_9FIRM|nr:YetF domain-containing protein [Caldisalinibacter kiritimatiensis]EOD00869.1 hypothetical protein L21TH_1072 [Caldisalinibacter kiritimatiensis]
MKFNTYTILYILLFTTAIVYIIFRIIRVKRINKNKENHLYTEHKFRDVELSLLGERFIDTTTDKTPFKLEPNIDSLQLPLELILNGEILTENLKAIRKDNEWLNKTINKKRINNIEDIDYAVLDSTGKVHVENKID